MRDNRTIYQILNEDMEVSDPDNELKPPSQAEIKKLTKPKTSKKIYSKTPPDTNLFIANFYIKGNDAYANPKLIDKCEIEASVFDDVKWVDALDKLRHEANRRNLTECIKIELLCTTSSRESAYMRDDLNFGWDEDEDEGLGYPW